MGLLGGAGKFVRRETAHIAGGEAISGWWQSARTSWFGAKRTCPACGEGRMFPFSAPIKGVDCDFLGCSRCDHYEAADLSDERNEAVIESLVRLREISKTKIGEMSKEDAAALKSRLKSNSRFQYAFSLFLLAVGGGLIYATGSPWHLLNATALAALLFAHGLRSSYRYWQVCNNVFYRPGSFRQWLGTGQWLV